MSNPIVPISELSDATSESLCSPAISTPDVRRSGRRAFLEQHEALESMADDLARQSVKADLVITALLALRRDIRARERKVALALVRLEDREEERLRNRVPVASASAPNTFASLPGVSYAEKIRCRAF